MQIVNQNVSASTAVLW